MKVGTFGSLCLLLLLVPILSGCSAMPSASQEEAQSKVNELASLAQAAGDIEASSLADVLPQMEFAGDTVFVPEVDDRTQVVVEEYPVDASELGFAFVVPEEAWREFERTDDSVVLSKSDYDALIAIRDAASILEPSVP